MAIPTPPLHCVARSPDSAGNLRAYGDTYAHESKVGRRCPRPHSPKPFPRKIATEHDKTRGSDKERPNEMQGNNSDGRPSQGYTSSPETEETKVKLTDAKNRPNKRHGRTLMPRQRARHACLECRARKVRCDVALTGAPCTNCKLDASSCAVQRRRNKRK